MNKFWVQRQNILPEGMPQKITYQRRVMKDSIDLLNEEFKSNRNKEKLNNIKNNEFKRSSSSKIMDLLKSLFHKNANVPIHEVIFFSAFSPE